MSYEIVMKPQRSSGLLSITDFCLSFCHHGVCETPRCQHSSVQSIHFFTWTLLMLPSKPVVTFSMMLSSFSINCSLKLVLLFPSPHSHSVAKPVSPRRLRVPCEGGTIFSSVSIPRTYHRTRALQTIKNFSKNCWKKIALGIIVYPMRI